MIALLLTLPFADVTATTVADRTRVPLSEPFHLTLIAEGPSPLAVSVPDEWLTPDSAANWRVRAVGPAVITPLADRRERWALTLRLDPYATGDPLPLVLNAATVRSGTDSVPHKVAWSPPAIQVTSGLNGATAEDARPITGIEAVPAAVRRRMWPGVVAGMTLLFAVALWTLRRRSRALHKSNGLTTVARWENEIQMETDPRELGRIVGEAVRRVLGPDFVCRTTAEIRQTHDARPDGEVSLDAVSLLEQADRVHFDPAASRDAGDLKALAIAWLRAR
jgi:hypothetical protein